jgi:hypothetical protein
MQILGSNFLSENLEQMGFGAARSPIVELGSATRRLPLRTTTVALRFSSFSSASAHFKSQTPKN